MYPKLSLLIVCVAFVLFFDNVNCQAAEDPNAPCTEADCNNRGGCLGLKSNPICLCRSPYTSNRCQEEVCEATRDCNGRGICLGTRNAVTCMCNPGYTGTNCETAVAGK